MYVLYFHFIYIYIINITDERYKPGGIRRTGITHRRGIDERGLQRGDMRRPHGTHATQGETRGGARGAQPPGEKGAGKELPGGAYESPRGQTQAILHGIRSREGGIDPCQGDARATL